MMGVLDLPDEPDEPRQAEHADTGGQDRPTPKPREMPDPDERGRIYDAMRAHVSAETDDAAESARRPDGTDKPSYWDSLPEFGARWADHEKHWPENRQPAVDRSDDPPGSYRSDGGFYLSPERHAEAVAAISRVRNVEPTLSADVQRVAQENRHGGWLEGFGNRIKGDGRLKEKVAEALETIGPDASPKEILQQVPDAIRYTFCLRPETYGRGYYDIKERLESLGYEMYESRNSWAATEYKGINTRWVTREGQRFEVQFHTAESFHAKQYVTHDAYGRIRNPLTSDEERPELEAFQREVSSRIEVPEGSTDIPDFKKEGF
jgi:hypothetical protein